MPPMPLFLRPKVSRWFMNHKSFSEQLQSYYLLKLKYPKLSQEKVVQKQPSRGVLRKSCSANMQQIYRRTPMPKCDFNNVALQLY